VAIRASLLVRTRLRGMAQPCRSMPRSRRA
jgi:hypothetical protein